MNRTKGYLLGSTALALLAACQVACADDEALFGALRTKVAELRQHEPEEVQSRIENARKYITECPKNEEATNSRVHIGLNHVDYTYTSISTSEDDQYYCLLLEKPLNRALSVDEARDFSAAMMMPDIQHFVGGQPTPEERASTAQIGEKHFLEIRSLVAAGKAKPLDAAKTERIIRPIGDLSQLEDCSRVPVDALDERSFARNSASNNNQALYNSQYYWRDLDPDGSRCIYMLEPFHRGLTIQEARDFLVALQLDLGYSQEFGKLMSNGEPTSQPAIANPNSSEGSTQKKRRQ